MQEKNFEENRQHIYQFVEKVITRAYSTKIFYQFEKKKEAHESTKLHLVFQSKESMAKSYINAYNLVNEFILSNYA
jgi:hypothetical protein